MSYVALVAKTVVHGLLAMAPQSVQRFLITHAKTHVCGQGNQARLLVMAPKSDQRYLILRVLACFYGQDCV